MFDAKLLQSSTACASDAPAVDKSLAVALMRSDQAAVARQEQFRCLNVQATVAANELPDLSLAPPPVDGYEPILARMKNWALISSLAPPNQPFTFLEIGSTADVCSSLVGAAVFLRFMGHDCASVTNEAVIPLQLRQIILQQLLNYHESLKGKHPEEQARAQALFEAAANRCQLQGNPY
jgi:hypothetical protein